MKSYKNYMSKITMSAETRKGILTAMRSAHETIEGQAGRRKPVRIRRVLGSVAACAVLVAAIGAMLHYLPLMGSDLPSGLTPAADTSAAPWPTPTPATTPRPTDQDNYAWPTPMPTPLDHDDYAWPTPTPATTPRPTDQDNYAWPTPTPMPTDPSSHEWPTYTPWPPDPTLPPTD